MDANLRTRIEQALLKACPDDPTARINLEDVPPDKIAGYVLSTTFEKWSPSERQELIWKEVEIPTINYHLKKVFEDSELEKDSVIRIFRITAADGKTYDTKRYNLSAIIAVGYKVNSERAVQFRKWATRGAEGARLSRAHANALSHEPRDALRNVRQRQLRGGRLEGPGVALRGGGVRDRIARADRPELPVADR
ncbi:MAG: virulence RhuM family protein [Polyangiaceae bacterium]|nr:virulence RhuM family protein [Polyangiaceae bacterium]